MADIPSLLLNDGNQIPQLGFGTYQIDPSDTAETVKKALEIGYRHIDTAQMYGNEAEVGQAVRESNLDRSEIFITSKLNNGFHEPEEARKAFAATLEKLDVGYIDLFLIHWPLPSRYDGDYVSTWKTLEEFKNDGRAKSIGVSNFEVAHLKKLADGSNVTPAVNQVELHPYFQNREVASYCEQVGIAVEAWSPIAQGDVLENATLQDIADKYEKSTAQVTLRWHIQKGYIIFPKSVTTERIENNFDIFDFELTHDDIAQIDGLDKSSQGRRGPDPASFDFIA